jgi:hypothetical protein
MDKESGRLTRVREEKSLAPEQGPPALQKLYRCKAGQKQSRNVLYTIGQDNALRGKAQECCTGGPKTSSFYWSLWTWSVLEN